MLRRVASCAFTFALLNAAFAQCPMEWAAGFGPAGVDGDVYALASFDDGRGPALWVGGNFRLAGDVVSSGLARWTGTRWEPAAPAWSATIRAFAIFDDGRGPALYAGGYPRNLLRWNGSQWVPLGPALTDDILCLEVWDDGTGPALYAGGAFRRAGGLEVNCVAKWDGRAWSALGSGVWDWWPEVNALAVYDDGGGAALYVGGAFSSAGGVPAANIARWDGRAWAPLAGGGANNKVTALCSYDDGSGPALYVGGWFSSVGGLAAFRLARRTTTGWSQVPGFVSADPVQALRVFDFGKGPELCVAGDGFTVEGGRGDGVMRYGPRGWAEVGGGVKVTVYCLTTFDGGHGPRLYAGGRIYEAGSGGAMGLAVCDGEFRPVCPGNGLDWPIRAFEVFDEGTGPKLFAAGGFRTGGGARLHGIGRWNGQRWSALGPNMEGPFPQWCALAVYDDGSGPALYVTGDTPFMGSLPVKDIARWDGRAWSTVGGGLGRAQGNYLRRAMAVFDDGRGSALYVAGTFREAGGVPAKGIARWDGQAWSAVGSGVEYGIIDVLTVFDDGQGPALYAAGDLRQVGGVWLSGWARWDGQAWSQPGGVGIYGGGIAGMYVWDDGGGPALYLGGSFQRIGNLSIPYIAKWTGREFLPLGSGLDGGSGGFCGFEDERGRSLYVAGAFEHAGGIPAHNMARWDGQRWHPLPYSGDFSGAPLVSFPDPNGPAVYTAADFFSGERPWTYFSKWACVAGWRAGDVNCDGMVDWRDVNPFVLALIDRAGYEQRYPDCIWCNADCNGDNYVDFNDISALANLLSVSD
ncbi:MAG: hypothetical protein AB1716_18440 [Planctomycetota bacterium]